jgi:hypothetical protein
MASVLLSFWSLRSGLVSLVSRLSGGEGGRQPGGARGDSRLGSRSASQPSMEDRARLPKSVDRHGRGGCYVYTYYFFQSWFHTYLVKAHGYSENDLVLSSLPFVVGACANFGGGFASNTAVKKLGLAWGRRSIGLAGLTIAGPCAAAVMFAHQRIEVLILLSLVFGGITFQQPTMFAVCLDIGGESAGAVVGAMNTAGQIVSLRRWYSAIWCSASEATMRRSFRWRRCCRSALGCGSRLILIKRWFRGLGSRLKLVPGVGIEPTRGVAP